ncbi:flagellar export chaperone FliS [Thalassospira tepidiphila]|jgi:flagellar secretion chaperone FliS|uniref:flagellar export chaperone FliS n=1 Tax=Thalassospira tepidiphila TaxID=393657 RepID=UPI001BD00D2A|nr:flagellar export chaperone FliS [Thalassospira tepidiphila]MBS8275585.1 flagellar export chaperone FliS [Thalassospira tepidiphila]
MNEHAAHTYKQQQVNTATPAKMVFMLFEKTLSRLQEAQKAIERNDIQGRCNANCSAQELIAHLANTLDMEQGGEIAANLERLYTHCMIRLMDVDRKNDPNAAAEVIKLLTPLRDSWAELSEKSEGELRQAVMTAQQDRPALPNEATQSSASAKDEAEKPAPAKSGLSISA